MSAREDFRRQWRRCRIVRMIHWTHIESWKRPGSRIARLLSCAAESRANRDDWRDYMRAARSLRLSIPSR